MLQANCLKRIVIASSECKAEEDLLYLGAMPFSALYVRISISYVIRCLTSSQCSLRRTGVMLERQFLILAMFRQIKNDHSR